MQDTIQKKVVVCDLDGTLAVSKTSIHENMARTISDVLKTHYFAVVSGGGWEQFEKQFLSSYMVYVPQESLFFERVLIFPTTGAECRRYDVHTNTWVHVYDNRLTEIEKNKIMDSFARVLTDSPETYLGITRSYGDIIEDRGEQITFSGCGQEAPIDVKSVWDPDQKRRKMIVESLKNDIPDFEITIGGTTSIDITRKGITKAYAIEKIKEVLSVSTKDIVFIGDALYPGGNDSIALTSGVDCISTSGPEETIEIFKKIS